MVIDGCSLLSLGLFLRDNEGLDALVTTAAITPLHQLHYQSVVEGGCDG